MKYDLDDIMLRLGLQPSGHHYSERSALWTMRDYSDHERVIDALVGLVLECPECGHHIEVSRKL